MHLILLAALCAPPASLHAQSPSGTPQPGTDQLQDHYQELVDLTRPAPGPLGLHAAATPADVFPQMAALAEGGWGPARAWCARHLDDLPPGTVPAAAAAARLFGLLAREHAGEPWLLDPALDPLRSLERAGPEVQEAVERALRASTDLRGEGQALALALRAVALAPRTAPDEAARARALELLAALTERHPASPLAPRATRLSWRIAHLSPGQEAPELVLTDLDGNQHRLSLLRGRVTLVDVWSVDDEDLLARGAARKALLARHPRGALDVLALGRGSTGPLAQRRLLEELDLDWPVGVAGPTTGVGAWPLGGGPLTVLLDTRGVVRAVGLEGAELEAAVERLLDAAGEADLPAALLPDEVVGPGRGR